MTFNPEMLVIIVAFLVVFGSGIIVVIRRAKGGRS